MVDRKEIPAIRFVVGATLAAYVAGQHIEFTAAPAKQTLLLGTVASTSSATVMSFNPTTFANVEAPPPVVPPGNRTRQG